MVGQQGCYFVGLLHCLHPYGHDRGYVRVRGQPNLEKILNGSNITEKIIQRKSRGIPGTIAIKRNKSDSTTPHATIASVASHPPTAAAINLAFTPTTYPPQGWRQWWGVDY